MDSIESLTTVQEKHDIVRVKRCKHGRLIHINKDKPKRKKLDNIESRAFQNINDPHLIGKDKKGKVVLVTDGSNQMMVQDDSTIHENVKNIKKENKQKDDLPGDDKILKKSMDKESKKTKLNFESLESKEVDENIEKEHMTKKSKKRKRGRRAGRKRRQRRGFTSVSPAHRHLLQSPPTKRLKNPRRSRSNSNSSSVSQSVLWSRSRSKSSEENLDREDYGLGNRSRSITKSDSKLHSESYSRSNSSKYDFSSRSTSKSLTRSRSPSRPLPVFGQKKEIPVKAYPAQSQITKNNEQQTNFKQALESYPKSSSRDHYLSDRDYASAQRYHREYKTDHFRNRHINSRSNRYGEYHEQRESGRYSERVPPYSQRHLQNYDDDDGRDDYRSEIDRHMTHRNHNYNNYDYDYSHYGRHIRRNYSNRPHEHDNNYHYHANRHRSEITHHERHRNERQHRERSRERDRNRYRNREDETSKTNDIIRRDSLSPSIASSNAQGNQQPQHTGNGVAVSLSKRELAKRSLDARLGLVTSSSVSHPKTPSSQDDHEISAANNTGFVGRPLPKIVGSLTINSTRKQINIIKNDLFYSGSIDDDDSQVGVTSSPTNVGCSSHQISSTCQGQEKQQVASSTVISPLPNEDSDDVPDNDNENCRESVMSISTPIQDEVIINDTQQAVIRNSISETRESKIKKNQDDDVNSSYSNSMGPNTPLDEVYDPEGPVGPISPVNSPVVADDYTTSTSCHGGRPDQQHPHLPAGILSMLEQLRSALASARAMNRDVGVDTLNELLSTWRRSNPELIDLLSSIQIQIDNSSSSQDDNQDDIVCNNRIATICDQLINAANPVAFSNSAENSRSKCNRTSTFRKPSKTAGSLVDHHSNLEDMELPSSAVEMEIHEKIQKKIRRQNFVEDQVKSTIKPYYATRQINKDEYKQILRQAVPQLCRSDETNPARIKVIVEDNMRKVLALRCRQHR